MRSEAARRTAIPSRSEAIRLRCSRTNRRFHRLSNPRDSTRRAQLHHFLIEVQESPSWNPEAERYVEGDRFACFHCESVLPVEHFARAHLTGTRGRNGARQRTRFCVPRGVGNRLYSPGSQVILRNGQNLRCLHVCRRCKRLRGGRIHSSIYVNLQLIEICI